MSFARLATAMTLASALAGCATPAVTAGKAPPAARQEAPSSKPGSGYFWVDGNWAWDGIRAIESGEADAYWGNGMRADLGVKRGVAKLLLDIRRGDGPSVARSYTFPALVTTDRLIEESSDAAAGAVRATVKTHQALRSDPSLATQVGQRHFPPTEAELIAGQIARDAEFYDPIITETMVDWASQFAQRVGMLDRPVTFDEAVATQFRDLWRP